MIVDGCPWFSHGESVDAQLVQLLWVASSSHGRSSCATGPTEHLHGQFRYVSGQTDHGAGPWNPVAQLVLIRNGRVRGGTEEQQR